MKFEEVLPTLREGKEIRRKSWVDKRRYSFEGGKFIYYSNEPEIYFKQFMEEDILLADDWEVVEGKKKVKLRDLTEEQFKKYCKSFTGNYNYGNDCDKCVFHKVSCIYWYENCWIKHKDLYSDEFLNQEVEIEEE